jgi:hypothetical protein
VLQGLTGIRLVLADCADPSRVDEFNAWYDRYASDCVRPGLLRTAARFDAREGTPGYLALYETSLPDPLGAWLDTFKHPARRHAHETSELLATALRASYALVSAVPEPDGSPLVGPVTIVASDAPDDPAVTSRDAWREHLRTAVAASGARGAACFELLDGSPAPPRFVEVYEGCSQARGQRIPGPPFSALRRRDVSSYELRWFVATD